MSLPTGVGTGLVTGRFVIGVIDSPIDDDLDPELIPAQGRISFTPSITYVPKHSDEFPVTILKSTITGILDQEGYLCTPDNTSPTGFTRGVRLFATDVGSVKNWTYNVKYSFSTHNGITPNIADHPISVPEGVERDLTDVVRIPSSPGMGVPQIESTALRAEKAAAESLESSLVSAEEARLAKEAALRAEQTSQVNDTGVAALLNDPESESSTVLTTILLVKADKSYVDSSLELKVDKETLSSELDLKADANHTHPVVSELSDGLMISSDKTKLDGSTASNVPNTLIQRNSVGNFSVAEATSPTHPATKGYVDTELTKKVNTETLNAELETKVEPIVSSYIASQPAVVDSAAAAVDANPKIATIEAALPFMGELANGTDFNTVRVRGIYGVRAQSTALTMINIPVPYAGMLIVEKPQPANLSQVYIGSGTGGHPSRHTRITRSDTSWSGSWASDRNMQGFVPSGTNLDTFQSAGDWIITPEIAATLIGWPEWLPASYATLNVIAEVRAIAFGGSQTLRALLPDGGHVVVDRAAEGETFSDWPGNPDTELDTGLSNSVLMQDWSRRMGGRKKVTTATAAFRFDHGLANFDSKIRVELESRGFKYSLALCSDQWDRAENVGVTPSMVDNWVLAGYAEIWNHSDNHSSGDGTETGWKSAILDGLAGLRSQIPSAQIDGFAIPGSVGTDFGGLTDGSTLEQFYATRGGKFVLSHHAVSSGYIGSNTRWQDGMPRQGLGHYTLDALTLTDVQNLVASAQADRRAIQFMLHPSRLDTAGYMTTAEFVAILNYVQGEQNAGRLKVVSPYEQLLTDVSGTVQGNDTGRRDITALFDGTAPNSTVGIAGGNVYLTRVGRMVELSMENVTLPPEQSTSFVQLGDIIPAGFLPPNERDYPLGARLTAEGTSGGSIRINRLTGRIYVYLHANGETIRVTATWFTEDPWPTSLPGTPA